MESARLLSSAPFLVLGAVCLVGCVLAFVQGEPGPGPGLLLLGLLSTGRGLWKLTRR